MSEKTVKMIAEQLRKSTSATRIKLKEGQIRQESTYQLYDTLRVNGGESPIQIHSFFSSVQGKPLSATNLRQNNMLEGESSFRIQHITLEGNTPDFNSWRAFPLMLNASALRLRIGEKDYLELPGLALGGQVDLALSDDEFACYQRYGDTCEIQADLKTHSLDIAPLQTFNVEWEVYSYGLSHVHTVDGMLTTEVNAATVKAGQYLRLMLTLNGLIRRPIQ